MYPETREPPKKNETNRRRRSGDQSISASNKFGQKKIKDNRPAEKQKETAGGRKKRDSETWKRRPGLCTWVGDDDWIKGSVTENE